MVGQAFICASARFAQSGTVFKNRYDLRAKFFGFALVLVWVLEWYFEGSNFENLPRRFGRF